jgi:hypothetical protein
MNDAVGSVQSILVRGGGSDIARAPCIEHDVAPALEITAARVR